MDKYEEEFSETNKQKHKEIREETKQKTNEAQQITDASWGEAFKAAGISAAITGTTSVAINIYGKVKSGKKITSFTMDDWKDVGYDFFKNGAKGGISGMSIYGLTKLGGFSAPFAGAITSSAMGVASLAYDYKNGNISKEEFADCACSMNVEAGLVAIGSAVGQAVIPVPVLGAIVGSVTIKSVLMVTKKVMNKKEKQLIDYLQKLYDNAIKELDSFCQKVIKDIDDYYEKLGGLVQAAFDKDLNTRLLGSIELATTLQVPPTVIIHNNGELDIFMKS